MQLKSILLMAGLAVLGFVVTFAIADPLCTPSVNGNTCILSYETDINGVPNIETDNPSSGRVIIYSPSCIAWGQAVITSNNPTSIMAFGLSAKNPLLFVPVYTSAIGYPVPKYEYDGKVYGYSNCDCQFDTSTQGHDCICRFECVPFELDSKDVIGVNETAWGDAGE